MRYMRRTSSRRPGRTGRRNPRHYGSQSRYSLAEEGYQIHKWLDYPNEVVLYDPTNDYEPYHLYVLNDDFAGATVEIEGRGYEFVSSWSPNRPRRRNKGMGYPASRHNLRGKPRHLRHSRRNPNLIILTNPGTRRTRRNKARSGWIKLPFRQACAEYPEMVRSPHYRKLLKHYKKFHGTEPKEVWVKDDGKRDTNIRMALGEAPDATYIVPGHSKKAGKKNIPYKHDFENPVMMVTDETGRRIELIPVNDKTRVEDWIYD